MSVPENAYIISRVNLSSHDIKMHNIDIKLVIWTKQNAISKYAGHDIQLWVKGKYEKRNY